MRSQATEPLEVLVSDAGQLYELLDDAEAALRQIAEPAEPRTIAPPDEDNTPKRKRAGKAKASQDDAVDG